MAGEEAVHRIDAGSQRQLVDPAQDQRLIGRLLRIDREGYVPTGVKGAVNVVVSAVNVERVLGEGACGHLDHHCRELPGSVVVLLEPVDHPLA